MKSIITLIAGLIFTTLLFTSCAKEELVGPDDESTYTMRTQKPPMNTSATERDAARDKDEGRTLGSIGIDPDKDEKDDDDDDYIILIQSKSRSRSLPSYQPK